MENIEKVKHTDVESTEEMDKHMGPEHREFITEIQKVFDKYEIKLGVCCAVLTKTNRYAQTSIGHPKNIIEMCRLIAIGEAHHLPKEDRC